MVAVAMDDKAVVILVAVKIAAPAAVSVASSWDDD